MESELDELGPGLPGLSSIQLPSSCSGPGMAGPCWWPTGPCSVWTMWTPTASQPVPQPSLCRDAHPALTGPHPAAGGWGWRPLGLRPGQGWSPWGSEGGGPSPLGAQDPALRGCSPPRALAVRGPGGQAGIWGYRADPHGLPGGPQREKDGLLRAGVQKRPRADGGLGRSPGWRTARGAWVLQCAHPCSAKVPVQPWPVRPYRASRGPHFILVVGTPVRSALILFMN